MTRPRRISPARRRRVIDALGRGTVPEQDLDLFAVGMERLARLDDELDAVARGGHKFKGVQGEYGSGKTFFSRWLAQQARNKRMASSEVQISQDVPLHKMDVIYQRLIKNLTTGGTADGAFRTLIDNWLLNLEDEVRAAEGINPADQAGVEVAVNKRIDSRLKEVADSAPSLSTALRAYRKARLAGDTGTATQLLAWVSGDRHVAALVKRQAGIKGDVNAETAFAFLRGLLIILRDCGHPGLLLVLDELETIQRLRSDVRSKSLGALRHLIDEIDRGTLPRLFLLITGTPAFFTGPSGVAQLAPLAQRLDVDFDTDPRFDSMQSHRLRLTGFDLDKLVELGHRVRDLYAEGETEARERIGRLVDDAYIKDLAAAVTGQLGVGTSPRVFLRSLVSDVLFKVAEHPDFDPRNDYARHRLGELTAEEENALRGSATSAGEIELDL
ncbi:MULTISPECIES: BREX system ATP-binding protein BrxD [Actinomadura]|uniref:BREX system ATP-binding protein BrxD n=1 Tax=Actinomadura yumaensis TaxID=111807 RepID=A0ABW2CI34_9ACTN|nr:BREX system ATP-binding protein BrxD [Actinomadura sp. J1-007]MWK37060.1 BREX system ATP-binding protein BrxD [Actinomadura sp. J1-007]